MYTYRDVSLCIKPKRDSVHSNVTFVDLGGCHADWCMDPLFSFLCTHSIACAEHIILTTVKHLDADAYSYMSYSEMLSRTFQVTVSINCHFM